MMIHKSKFFRGTICALLCLTLCASSVPLAMAGDAAVAPAENVVDARPYTFEEIRFAQHEGVLWLAGRVNPGERPLAVAVYMSTSQEMLLPNEATYLYPVDEQGYFALPAAEVVEDGALASKYDLYVVDAEFPPPNDYSEIRLNAASHSVYDLTGNTIESILQGVPALSEYMPGVVPVPAQSAQTPPSATEPAPSTPVEITVAEPTVTPLTEPTVVPAPESTAAPTPKPTAAPTPESTVVPTPEPTAVPTPEPTAAPTPEPLMMSEDEAKASALELIAAQFNDVQSASSGAVINDLLVSRLQRDLLIQSEPEGGFRAVLTAPNFQQTPSVLPLFNGEDPAAFLLSWKQAVRDAASALGEGNAPLDLSVPQDGQWSNDDQNRLQLWLWNNSSAKTWLQYSLSNAKAYSALSSILFPVPADSTLLAGKFADAEQAPIYVSQPEPPAPTPRVRRMVRGHEGDDVKQAQEVLIAKGYLQDDADGIFGSKMEQAVEAFQKDNGLKVDGFLTAKVQQVLFAPSAASSAGNAGTVLQLLQARGVSQEDLDAWWPVFLQTMSQIRWDTETNGMPKLVYEQIAVENLAVSLQQLAASVDSDSFRTQMTENAIELIGTMDPSKMVTLTTKLTSDPNATWDQMLEALAGPLADAFEAFLASMKDIA